MRKILLVIALLFNGLAYAQRYSQQEYTGIWPEKGNSATIIIVSVLVFFIIGLTVIIIRKSKERGRKIIVDGFNSKRFGKAYIMHSLFKDSSSQYSKRRDRNKGIGSGTGLGAGGFGGGW